MRRAGNDKRQPEVCLLPRTTQSVVYVVHQATVVLLHELLPQVLQHQGLHPNLKGNNRAFLIRVAVVATIILTAFTAKADKVAEMMLPSVFIETKAGVGSGTVVHINEDLGTFIVTNYHVVRRQQGNIKVRFYNEEALHDAYIHSINKEQDIAVIVTAHKAKAAVTFYHGPVLFEPTYCIGASLGMSPAPTRGEVSGPYFVYKEQRYHRMECHIVFGNSGGGMYVERFGAWVYVGMPSMVRNHIAGFVGVPITFLGLSVISENIMAHLTLNNIPFSILESGP